MAATSTPNPVAPLGTKAITTVIDSLFAITVSAISTFKDGIQIGDIKFIPEAVKHVIIISNNIKGALAEAQDLEPEELGQVLGGFGAKLMYLFKDPDKLIK